MVKQDVREGREHQYDPSIVRYADSGHVTQWTNNSFGHQSDLSPRFLSNHHHHRLIFSKVRSICLSRSKSPPVSLVRVQTFSLLISLGVLHALEYKTEPVAPFIKHNRGQSPERFQVKSWAKKIVALIFRVVGNIAKKV